MAPVVSDVHHPVFAWLYERLAPGADKAGAAEHRQELLRGLSGRVVEVGAGTGLNLAHYPADVTEVVAVEPEPRLRRACERAAADAAVPVTVVDGVADALPVEDASVDAVVYSLVLCSVPDPQAALAEARRVLRPDGHLRVYEHVLSTNDKMSRRQRRIDRWWPKVSGGCHCSRDTLAELEAAGFDTNAIEAFDFNPGLFKWVEPHVLGHATPR